MYPYRVLVVEDQPFQREYLLQLLRDQGVTSLTAAEDGSQALEYLERESFDLVLSDLMMPELDGVQLIQRLADLDEPPQLAIMSSSSLRMIGSACLVARGLGLPLVGQLSKPIQWEDVRDLLVRLGEQLKTRKVRHPRNEYQFTRAELEVAIRGGQIQAWFQPKKSLADDRIVAAEALVRWIRPTGEMLMPGAFIGSIERLQLDELLLNSVTSQVLRAQSHWWNELGRWVPISVNLPTYLLDDQGLPDRLHDLVVARGGSPAGICFELMESSITREAGNYYAGACRLRMKGFGLAQDDFGQGYSSLYQLVSAPFSELKIDRALVQGCVSDKAMATTLESIVSLGRKLGLAVVAEGVESQAELNLLRQFGCDQVQGFLISEAISPTAFERMLGQAEPALGR